MNRALVPPLVVGLAGAAGTIAFAAVDPRRALVSWIAAYGFGLSIALGGLALVMVMHATGAKWWRALRPVFYAVAGTTPLFALLFIPIGAGFASVYPWASPPPHLDAPLREALLHQQQWNAPLFFLARALFYLAIWTALSVLLRRADAASVAHASEESAETERRLGGVGLPILALTVTFASFDWFMSLEPAWTSNMYGVYVFTSGLLSALAAIAVGTWLAAGRGLLDGVRADHLHALGRLMLMALILWAYIAFFQLLLYWIADIPREVTFYAARAHGMWAAVDWVLVFGRFALPFLLLLSRPLKRRPSMLAGVGVWLLLMGALDFAWLVLPSWYGARLSWPDAAPFACVTGLGWAYATHLAYARGAARMRAPDEAARREPGLREALRYRSP